MRAVLPERGARRKRASMTAGTDVSVICLRQPGSPKGSALGKFTSTGSVAD
jgi:hypothetical protein